MSHLDAHALALAGAMVVASRVPVIASLTLAGALALFAVGRALLRLVRADTMPPPVPRPWWAGTTLDLPPAQLLGDRGVR